MGQERPKRYDENGQEIYQEPVEKMSESEYRMLVYGNPLSMGQTAIVIWLVFVIAYSAYIFLVAY